MQKLCDKKESWNVYCVQWNRKQAFLSIAVDTLLVVTWWASADDTMLLWERANDYYESLFCHTVPNHGGSVAEKGKGSY